MHAAPFGPGEVKNGHIVLRGPVLVARFQSEGLVTTTTADFETLHVSLDDVETVVHLKFDLTGPSLDSARATERGNRDVEQVFLVPDSVMQMLRGLGLDQRFYFIVVRTWEHWDLDKDCPAPVVSLGNLKGLELIVEVLMTGSDASS